MSKRMSHSLKQLIHDEGRCDEWSCPLCIAEREVEDAPPWYTVEEAVAMQTATVDNDNGKR